MIVAVTGARGYVGRHLVERLGAGGFGIVACSRPPPAAWSHVPLRVVVGDLLDDGVCEDAVRGADAVVHCAARLRGGGAGEYYRDNVLATERLVGAAARAGVTRFVHLSTVEVYGRREHQHTTEDAPIDHGDDDPYARTKAWAEAVVRGREGLRATILRPGLVWGGPYDDRLVGKLVAALRGYGFAYPGPCVTPLPLTHADNLALAVSLALRANADGPFNVTDGTDTSFRELVERLADHHALARPRAVIPLQIVRAAVRGLDAVRFALPELMPGLRRTTVELLNTPCQFSIDRARDALGYRPEPRGFEAVPAE